MRELNAFVKWATANPKSPDENGRIQPWEVAALTFYRGQEALIRKKLQTVCKQRGNTRNFRLPKGSDRPVKITLCTVDRFQGHEADVVFLSFVKSGSVGFLDSPNRLNVGLTRAKYQLVLIGDRKYFIRCRSELLRELANSRHWHGHRLEGGRMIKLKRKVKCNTFDVKATIAVGRDRPEFLAVALLAQRFGQTDKWKGFI